MFEKFKKNIGKRNKIMNFIRELEYTKLYIYFSYSKESKDKGIETPSVTCDYVISRLKDIIK